MKSLNSESGGGSRSIALRLPDELYEHLKGLEKRTGLTLSDLVRSLTSVGLHQLEETQDANPELERIRKAGTDVAKAVEPVADEGDRLTALEEKLERLLSQIAQ